MEPSESCLRRIGRKENRKLSGNPNPNDKGKKQREIGRGLRESQRNYLFETGMSACKTEHEGKK